MKRLLLPLALGATFGIQGCAAKKPNAEPRAKQYQQSDDARAPAPANTPEPAAIKPWPKPTLIVTRPKSKSKPVPDDAATAN